ncbi:hypothetical protein STAS_19897 [Striga asiatica]|uniref:Uncharacterized protein n=1 Tax=Striga asiatica TaxID=4170 RepID=A0A5A7QDQ6_STRAF|nr:hypothetical protein STAS_19897 [Striga asiatica]
MSEKSHEEAFKSIEKLPDDESWPSNLIRAPSLSPRTQTEDQNPGNTKVDQKNEEIQDEESDFSMGKLIRQASLTNSESFPPRRHVKKLAPNSSISRHGSIMKTDLSKLGGPSGKIIRAQRVMNQLKTQKSMNDLELYNELQGFKDLSLDPESSNGQTSASPNGKKSAEDIKAQIKFWARAVASNARQES